MNAKSYINITTTTHIFMITLRKKINFKIPIDILFNYFIIPKNFYEIPTPKTTLTLLDDPSLTDSPFTKEQVYKMKQTSKSSVVSINAMTEEIKKNQKIHIRFAFTDIEFSNVRWEKLMEIPVEKEDLLLYMNKYSSEIIYTFTRIAPNTTQLKIEHHRNGNIRWYNRFGLWFESIHERIIMRSYWKSLKTTIEQQLLNK